MTSLRQRVLDELQRRNYSPATIRGYILAIKQFVATTPTASAAAMLRLRFSRLQS